MATYYAYSLTVWLRVSADQSTTASKTHKAVRDLIDSLGAYDFERVKEPEIPDEYSYSFQYSATFNSSEMDEEEEPSESAIDELTCELTEFLKQHLNITFLEILDDGFTSFRLEKWDE